MENKPDRYDLDSGIYYDSEGIGYRFEVKNLGRFLFDFARFTFKFNSMFRVWNYRFLLDLFGLIFVPIDKDKDKDSTKPDKSDKIDKIDKPELKVNNSDKTVIPLDKSVKSVK